MKRDHNSQHWTCHRRSRRHPAAAIPDAVRQQPVDHQLIRSCRMRAMLVAWAALVLVTSASTHAVAQDVIEIDEPLTIARPTSLADAIAAQANALAADPQGTRPTAIEYSDAHETRAKIHKYVSWAALPLMATEFALGEKLYNDPNSIDS